MVFESKMILKILGIIFVVDLISNIILLLLFEIPLNQQTLIIAGVFTIVLTLILKQAGVLNDGKN